MFIKLTVCEYDSYSDESLVYQIKHCSVPVYINTDNILIIRDWVDCSLNVLVGNIKLYAQINADELAELIKRGK